MAALTTVSFCGKQIEINSIQYEILLNNAKQIT